MFETLLRKLGHRIWLASFFKEPEDPTRVLLSKAARDKERESKAARRIVEWAKVNYPPDAARPLVAHLTAEGLATREEIGKCSLYELDSFLGGGHLPSRIPKPMPATSGFTIK